MSENIETNTETTNTETEQVIVEARVNTQTLKVAAIASAAGAAVVGVACYLARRSSDEPDVEEYVVYEESDETDTE